MNNANQNNTAAALVALLRNHEPSHAASALMAACAHVFRATAAQAATQGHFASYARQVWCAVEQGDRLVDVVPDDDNAKGGDDG